MKQNMKRVVLVLCMAVSFLFLSACAKKEDAAEAPIPENIEATMFTGAENYLRQFDSYTDEELNSEIKKQEKQQNTMMVTALEAWKSSRQDLGGLISIESGEVERVGEDSYCVTVRAEYEKRGMVFTLTAEETMGNAYGGLALMPVEMVFSPEFTMGEKLSKAGMNTLMGMGTVFVVLIFISFVIASLKSVNTWEQNMKKKEAEKQAAAAPAPVQKAAAPVNTPAPAPAPAKSVETPVLEEVPAAEIPEENLADDLELVAVITAAISAAQGVPAEGLVVRSIRRKTSSNWKRA